MTLYLLDTNAISDMISHQTNVIHRVAEHLAAGDSLGLCRPVHYEVVRGLFWRGATGKLSTYMERVIPLLTWVELIEPDWEDAARLWAEARRGGKQLGDPDLLLAALARRIGAILVSSDSDFEAFPIRCEDWRK